jgi:hypothetical protein
MSTHEVFDDEMNQAETEEEVYERAEEIMRETARAEAPDDVCGHCNERQPLGAEYARDVGVMNLWRDTAEAAARHTGGDLGFIESDLSDVFYREYHDAAADASDCRVCNNPDSFERCGHERHGGNCPARK